MSNDFIKLIKGRAWSPVPDDILQDTRMSLKTRAVLAWIVGRPTNWDLYIRQMQRALGMTETMWKSIRSELETAGYYRQQRVQLPDGKIHWEKSITDVSDPPSPGSPRMANTIHGRTRHGSTSGGRAIHGAAIGGEVGDIPSVENQRIKPPPPDFEQSRSSPPPPTSAWARSAASIEATPVEDNIDDFVEAAYWQAIKADKQIKNPSAWKARVRQRLQLSGPSPEDRFCLETWRAFLKAIERRQAEEVEKAAKAAQPVADREFARERASTLSRSFGRSASRRKNSSNGETTANQPQDDGETPS